MTTQSNEFGINRTSPNGVRLVWNTMRDFITAHGTIDFAPPSKLQIGTWLLLSIAIAIIALLQSGHYQLGAYMDDANYVVLSKSIVQGPSFGLINAPQEPLPSRYPFGFPLLLSPFINLFSTHLGSLTIVSLIFTLVNIALLFWGWPYLSQAKSYWWGLAVAALTGLSPLVIGHTDMVMSEPAFTTFMLIALILAELCLTSSNHIWRNSILLGVSIAFATSVRTIGIVLLAVLVIRLVLLSTVLRFKAIRIFIGTITGAVVFYIAIIILTPVTFNSIMPTEYVDQFESPASWGQADAAQPGIISRFAEGVGFYVQIGIRDVVLPIGGGEKEVTFGKRFGLSNLPGLIGVVISGIILLGACVFLSGSGTRPTVLFFEIAYLGAVAVWPWRLSRLLYPIQPFLILHLLFGVMFIVMAVKTLLRHQGTKPVRRPSVEILFAGLVGIIFMALNLYKVLPSQVGSQQYTRDLSVGTDWLRSNTSQDTAVFAEQPESIYLYSGRKTLNYPEFKNVDELKTSMKEKGINYVFVAPVLEWRTDGLLAYDNYTATQLIPMLDSLVSQGQMKLVYQSDSKDKIAIYQLVTS